MTVFYFYVYYITQPYIYLFWEILNYYSFVSSICYKMKPSAFVNTDTYIIGKSEEILSSFSQSHKNNIVYTFRQL